MSRHGRQILVIAPDGHRLHVIEATTTGQGTTAGRTTTLGFDPSAPAEHLAANLKQALHDAGMTARRVVIDLSCRDVMTTTVTLPPAAPAAAVQVLRMEARRCFVTEVDQLALDCDGPLPGASGGAVLLAATRRSTLAVLLEGCRGAGLRPVAAGVGATLCGGSGQARPGLHLCAVVGPDAAEVSARLDGRLRALRHLALTGHPGEDAWIESLRSGLRRTGLSLGQTEPTIGLTLVDMVEPDAAVARAVAERLDPTWEVTTRACPGPQVGIDVPAEVEVPRRALPGLALPAALAGRRPLELDFMSSRLAVKTDGRRRRRVGRLVAVVTIALACVAALLWDLGRRQRQLEQLQGRLAEMQPRVERARMLVARVNTAAGWTDRRPMFLEPIRQLAETVPRSAPVWVTSLAMRQDRRVVLTGKADNEKSVLELLDLLRSEPTFVDAKLLYLRQAGGSRPEVVFSMMFDTR